MTNPVNEKLIALAERNHKLEHGLPVVKKGSDEWNQWRAFYKIHNISTSFMDARSEWTVPSVYPPSDIDTALSKVSEGKTRRYET